MGEMNRRTSVLNIIIVPALLVFLWSVLLDWHFVVGEFNLTTGQLGIGALIYVAFIGGWVWGIVAAAQGGNRALIVLLIYAILLCAYAIMDLLVYCPETCPSIPLYYIANWANLIMGLLAVVAVVVQMRQRPAS
jgi:hypothetical protein